MRVIYACPYEHAISISIEFRIDSISAYLECIEFVKMELCTHCVQKLL